MESTEEKTRAPSQMMVSVPLALFDALLDAAEDLCLAATFYPSDEFGTPEMIVDTDCVTALSAALNALEGSADASR
ncbi:MAG: hypothetical protein EA420_03180 [Candidatus Competibacteraceae bacterium]|nr:MAG: hypothetical protein EA420_03180 [Candidatus Competibacteraceae bacterium]